MSTNENVEYEKLVQDIYTALHNQEEVDTINVQQDVLIEGRSGFKHQIDVYWEFELAGLIYKVAIECKNWNNNVPIGKIRDFFGVLHDIGDIKGVFVTKVGFQSGAIQFADYYGIDIKEARVPTEKDWEGRIKDIVIQLGVVTTDIIKREPILDKEWIIENEVMEEGEEITIKGFNNELKLYDSNDKEITSFYDLEQKLPHNWEREKKLSHTYFFEDAYMYVNDKKLKIKAIKYTYNVNRGEEKVMSEGEKIIKAILKDVKTGKIDAIREDGGVN